MRWTVHISGVSQKFRIQGSSEMRLTVYISGISQNVARILDSGEFFK